MSGSICYRLLLLNVHYSGYWINGRSLIEYRPFIIRLTIIRLKDYSNPQVSNFEFGYLINGFLLIRWMHNIRLTDVLYYWYLGARGSMTFLFMAQILSHSMKTTDLEEPWAKMNCLRASMVRPRRRTPRTVGKRGSSQPSTLPLSTNQVNLRLDIT